MTGRTPDPALSGTRVTLLLAMVCLSACDGEAPETIPGRWYTQADVDAGAALYDTYCAQCHGPDGSATPDWRTPGPDGNYPPPPLNGTAHTWHHPFDVLSDTIAAGGAPFGGVMPAFGPVLAEDDRRAIIAWVQSLWNDDIYRRWTEIDARSQ